MLSFLERYGPLTPSELQPYENVQLPFTASWRALGVDSATAPRRADGGTEAAWDYQFTLPLVLLQGIAQSAGTEPLDDRIKLGHELLGSAPEGTLLWCLCYETLRRLHDGWKQCKTPDCPHLVSPERGVFAEYHDRQCATRNRQRRFREKSKH